MTIIATIGYQKFALQSMEDAEAMLKILARAQAVDSTHDEKYNHYYVAINETVGIEINTSPIVSAEQHAEVKAKLAEAKSNTIAANQETQAAA